VITNDYSEIIVKVEMAHCRIHWRYPHAGVEKAFGGGKRKG
jgi:hypothetical protein